MSIPKITILNKGSVMTRAERKAARKSFYADQKKWKNEAIDAIKKDKIDELINFTNEQRATGKLYRSILDYQVGYKQFNIYFDEEPKPFPVEFLSINSEVFDNTYVIGFDTDDITYRATSSQGVRYMPIYDDSTPDVKVEFDRCIEAGERSNPQLKIFNKYDPTLVHSVKINIWENPTIHACWFKYDLRPNRIYLSDYDGFKIFDFKLNLLYFKPVRTDYGLYGFKVNPENWNDVWIWSSNIARTLFPNQPDENGKYRDYHSDMDGIENISEYFRS